MGCDIHMVVEQYEADYERDENGRVKRWKLVIGHDGAYGNRNYEVFTMLAGVRNYDELKPIAEPRGLPDDLSPEARKELELGDHSASWLTLKEILAHDWDTLQPESGFVNAIEASRIIKGTRPQSWSQGIGGGGVRIVTESEMRDLLQQHPLPKGIPEDTDPWTLRDSQWPLAQTYTRMSWTFSPRERCASFFEWLLSLARHTRLGYSFDWVRNAGGVEKTLKLRDGAGDNIRLVFNFDN